MQKKVFQISFCSNLYYETFCKKCGCLSFSSPGAIHSLEILISIGFDSKWSSFLSISYRFVWLILVSKERGCIADYSSEEIYFVAEIFDFPYIYHAIVL